MQEITVYKIAGNYEREHARVENEIDAEGCEAVAVSFVREGEAGERMEHGLVFDLDGAEELRGALAKAIAFARSRKRAG